MCVKQSATHVNALFSNKFPVIKIIIYISSLRLGYYYNVFEFYEGVWKTGSKRMNDRRMNFTLQNCYSIEKTETSLARKKNE